MPSIRKSPHRLADVEKRHAESEAFEIPSREEREDLRPGDLAKLVFEEIGERLWVRVTNVMVYKTYVGTIESSPLYSDIHRGDEVVFMPENIADVEKKIRFCKPEPLSQ